MQFEYDPGKNRSNKDEHGVDFEEAQRLRDGSVVKAPSPGDCGEERCVVFGAIDGKNWTAVATYRKERVRVISVRRSRKQEVLYYDEANKR